MYLGVAERRVPYPDLCPQIKKNRVTSINPILFGIGIPNWVCGHILGSRSAVYSLAVTVTLIFGYSIRKLGRLVLSNNSP